MPRPAAPGEQAPHLAQLADEAALLQLARGGVRARFRHRDQAHRRHGRAGDRAPRGAGSTGRRTPRAGFAPRGARVRVRGPRPADLVLLAMGYLHPVHRGMLEQLGVSLDGRGNVKADTFRYQTSNPRVLRGGRHAARAVPGGVGHPRRQASGASRGRVPHRRLQSAALGCESPGKVRLSRSGSVSRPLPFSWAAHERTAERIRVPGSGG